LQCDSLHASYKNCVKPIFVANCYSCHSDTASQGGTIAFDIENFVQLKNYLNYYYHNDSIYGSKFLREINQQTGVLQMPPSYKIEDSDIAIVRYWIANGAPDN
jgi:mono/diheme cytochrome c family protein